MHTPAISGRSWDDDQERVFRVEIELGNDAMCNGEHVAVVLVKIAKFLNTGELEEGQRWRIDDDNGNRVGHWEVVEEEA